LLHLRLRLASGFNLALRYFCPARFGP